jgi:hypothetical protein
MPATLFFRMAYPESLLLLLSILALFAMARKWPSALVALIVGLGTATRPVGIGLLAPFFLYLRDRSRTRRDFVFSSLCLLPVACSGIIAYMLFQALQFGDPLGFAKTQSHWGLSPYDYHKKLLALLTGEPLWAPYVPGSPSYWRADDTIYPAMPFFSWVAVNPLYFLFSTALIMIGACKRWLSSYEAILGLAFLLIPYSTRAYEMSMASHARFSAAVFPVYLVLGNILARLPATVAMSLLGISAFYLGAFSALFAAWFNIF